MKINNLMDPSIGDAKQDPMILQYEDDAKEKQRFEEFSIAIPSFFLHILTSYDLSSRDLAKLEATCRFFRSPESAALVEHLSIVEVAALDSCRNRSVFRHMSPNERENLKRKCGGSWKLVLDYLQACEFNCRRGKPQALAGLTHSIVVTSNGSVYSFGSNEFGQLGLGATRDNMFQPCLIRSLQGVRIVQAAVGAHRTMVVSDTGRVYVFGKELFGHTGEEDESPISDTPKLVESLEDIFVVQVAIGGLFTAVLSGEGKVYTMCWGRDGVLGHQTNNSDSNPSRLLGELESLPVVHIAAGYCYLLALAYQPSGMSVYSVGCGLGGKLGHGSAESHGHPQLITEFQALSLEPMIVSAGSFHAAVVCKDGRVCTWGWGTQGRLGHDNMADFQDVPKVVQELIDVKAVNVAAGRCTTYVVTEDGDVYSFGLDPSNGDDWQNNAIDEPKLITSLQLQMKERVVEMKVTNSYGRTTHTFALTESEKLYAFGHGHKGQLGVKADEENGRCIPGLVGIDLG